MADNASDNLRAEFEKQIADLKSEIAALNKSLSESASYAADKVEGVFESTRDTARGAAKQVRQQAHLVSDAMRENPGTAATVLSSAGIIGFIIGVAAGCVIAGNSSGRSYFR